MRRTASAYPSSSWVPRSAPTPARARWAWSYLPADLRRIPGVGEATEARLNRLGIHTIRDLLWHLPFRYIDRERIASVAGVSPGERVTLWGEITRLTMRPTRRRPLWLVRGRLTDGTGEIELVWFVRAYGQ